MLRLLLELAHALGEVLVARRLVADLVDRVEHRGVVTAPEVPADLLEARNRATWRGKAMDWVRLRPWRSAMRTPKSLQTTSRMRSMPVVEGPRSPSRKPRARRARFRSMCWLISWA